MDELVNEIIAELTIELQNQPTFNADILANKVKGAYRKVRNRKCYENTSYSEEQINEDLRATKEAKALKNNNRHRRQALPPQKADFQPTT